MVIMCDCFKANMGCRPVCLLLLPSQSYPPSPSLPVSVCSLPLLCSLSEDWGEPVAPCDEGLLWDVAVSGPGEQSWSEVTGCWRRSVASVTQSSPQSILHLCSNSKLWISVYFLLERRYLCYTGGSGEWDQFIVLVISQQLKGLSRISLKINTSIISALKAPWHL